MPIEITYNNKRSRTAYRALEAKHLGLIDSAFRDGSHVAVSEPFEIPSEGDLLDSFLTTIPDALLVAGKRTVTVYRPKETVLAVPELDEEAT